MTFHSILFEGIEDRTKTEPLEAPGFFGDLNLDQIIDTITVGRQEYNLKPLFYTSLTDAGGIKYRHEVMRDLENRVLFESITSFARKMREMRERLTLADKSYYKYQKDRWFLDAVDIYCDTVKRLAHDLSTADLKSRGLLAFRDYLEDYSESEHFSSLRAETTTLLADLSTIKYCLLIKGNGFKVRKYQSEIDYSAEVLNTFEKFKQGAVKDYKPKFPSGLDMNHIEAKALEFVAKLYPEIFGKLDNYCSSNGNYLDKTLAEFDREIEFYIAYLEYAGIFKRAGLKVCYPKVSSQSKDVYDYEGYDLALAYKLFRENTSVVCNDFYLKDQERILVVSGPNQGGKTTFRADLWTIALSGQPGLSRPRKRSPTIVF
jgi:DNA mismatch repair protein MutS